LVQYAGTDNPVLIKVADNSFQNFLIRDEVSKLNPAELVVLHTRHY